MNLIKALTACGFAVLSGTALADGPAAGVMATSSFGCGPVHYLSAASNNATSVTTIKTTLYVVTAINTTSALYYLKLYDKATAPTCGTDTPVATYPVPHNTGAGGGLVQAFAPGLQFGSGVGFCLVGGIADADNSNAATGVAINLCTH